MEYQEKQFCPLCGGDFERVGDSLFIVKCTRCGEIFREYPINQIAYGYRRTKTIPSVLYHVFVGTKHNGFIYSQKTEKELELEDICLFTVSRGITDLRDIRIYTEYVDKYVEIAECQKL